MNFQHKLLHPGFVRFVGAIFNQNNLPVWILSEYVPGGSLQSLLKKREATSTFLPKAIVISFAHDILSALSYLHHTMRGMHRDIKSANVLIATEGMERNFI